MSNLFNVVLIWGAFLGLSSCEESFKAFTGEDKDGKPVQGVFVTSPRKILIKRNPKSTATNKRYLIAHTVKLPQGFTFAKIDKGTLKFGKGFHVNKITSVDTVSPSAKLYQNYEVTLDNLERADMWFIGGPNEDNTGPGAKKRELGFGGEFSIDRSEIICDDDIEVGNCVYKVPNGKNLIEFITSLINDSEAIEEYERILAEDIRVRTENELLAIFGDDQLKHALQIEYKNIASIPENSVKVKKIVPASSVACSIAGGFDDPENQIVTITKDSPDYQAVINLNSPNIRCSVNYEVPEPNVSNPLPGNGAGFWNNQTNKNVSSKNKRVMTDNEIDRVFQDIEKRHENFKNTY